MAVSAEKLANELITNGWVELDPDDFAEFVMQLGCLLVHPRMQEPDTKEEP